MSESTLFVFGNGFDLAHGLPTKYADFFCFLEAIKHSANTSFRSRSLAAYKSIISPEMEQYITSAFLNHRAPPAYIETIIQVMEFENSSKENIWHCYFRKRLSESLPSITWIDFEKEIEHLIKLIEQGPHDSIPELLRYVKRNTAYSYDKILELFSKPEYYDLDSLNASQKQELIQTCENDLAAILHQQLLRYSFCFELYLRFYVLSAERIPSRTPFFDKLFKEKLLGYQSEPSSDSSLLSSFVLSLNYTDTFEQVYGIYNNVHHIHGRIRDTSDIQSHMNDASFHQETPIILGYYNTDPDQDYSPTPFLCFEKYYQRIQRDTGRDVYDWLNNINSKIKSHKPYLRAIFYGHSLDITDKDLIRSVFEVADHIDIYYHSKDAIPNFIVNLTKILGKDELSRSYNNRKFSFLPTD